VQGLEPLLGPQSELLSVLLSALTSAPPNGLPLVLQSNPVSALWMEWKQDVAWSRHPKALIPSAFLLVGGWAHEWDLILALSKLALWWAGCPVGPVDPPSFSLGHWMVHERSEPGCSGLDALPVPLSRAGPSDSREIQPFWWVLALSKKATGSGILLTIGRQWELLVCQEYLHLQSESPFPSIRLMSIGPTRHSAKKWPKLRQYKCPERPIQRTLSRRIDYHGLCGQNQSNAFLELGGPPCHALPLEVAHSWLRCGYEPSLPRDNPRKPPK
jgi:hypothetical protein